MIPKKTNIEPVYESDFTINRENIADTIETKFTKKINAKWIIGARIILLLTFIFFLSYYLYAKKNNTDIDEMVLNEIKNNNFYLIYIISQIVLFISSFFFPRISFILAIASLYGFFNYDIEIIYFNLQQIVLLPMIIFYIIITIIISLKIIFYFLAYKNCDAYFGALPQNKKL